jgi:hypothetical protein
MSLWQNGKYLRQSKFEINCDEKDKKWLLQSPIKTEVADAEKQIKSRRNLNCCDYGKEI